MMVLGCDIGQAQDFTAMAIVRSVDQGGKRWYECGWLEQMPLGTAYHQIIERIKDIKNQQKPITHIALDATGVGRPIVELARREIRGTNIIGVTITGGQRPGEKWRIPKRDLITQLQVGIQKQYLRIHAGLAFANTLREELLDYQVSISKDLSEQFGPKGSATHDDLVLALALAYYVLVKSVPPR